jgi:hypothetical protein
VAEADALWELLDVRLTSELEEHGKAIDTVTKVRFKRARPGSSHGTPSEDRIIIEATMGS